MQIVAVSVELGQRAADVAIASHQTTLDQLPAQQRVPHKPIHQCFFSGGTSRYGVPENLTTG